MRGQSQFSNSVERAWQKFINGKKDKRKPTYHCKRCEKLYARSGRTDKLCEACWFNSKRKWKGIKNEDRDCVKGGRKK